MFSFEELCSLIRVVSETRVAGLEVEREGIRVRIDGVPVAPVAAPALAHATELPLAGHHPPVATPSPMVDEDEGLVFVTSPIVGTFYRAPNPDASPYVDLGVAVAKGQVVCIVEAMKLMNEIEAEVSGTVARILVENGHAVEFGQRLFALRPV